MFTCSLCGIQFSNSVELHLHRGGDDCIAQRNINKTEQRTRDMFSEPLFGALEPIQILALLNMELETLDPNN